MTDREKVYLLIGDLTVPPHFGVNQVDAFLEIAGGSVMLAASYALEGWAASLTSEFSSEHIGDYSYSKKEVDNKIALAKKYREEESISPSITWAEPNLMMTEEAE